MPSVQVLPPFEIFTDVDGEPLEDGYLYIGAATLNPETNPVSVFFDAALTVPAVQPIRTRGGYPSNDGAPAKIYIVATTYSIRVKNKNSTTVNADLNITSPADAGRITFIQAGTGAETRSAQDKAREIQVSVTDFMTDAERADALSGAPVLDHSPAFTDWLARVTVSGGRGYIPKGTYNLVTNVLGNWTQVVVQQEGAVLGGTGLLFAVQHITNKAIASREVRLGTAELSSQTVGKYDQIFGEGTISSYGSRQDYRHTGTLTTGFALGRGNNALFDSITTGGQGMARWEVVATPTLASGGSWGVVLSEQNVMNRGPDNGYAKLRGAFARWSGGIQLIPESRDLLGGTGNICRNIGFSYATASSAVVNNLGFVVKSYNGLLIEQDSIGPSGRGVLASGDSSGEGSQLPNYALEIDQRWRNGIYTRDATFVGNIAANLGDNQVISWGDTGPTIFGSGASGGIRLASTGAGTIQMNPGGTTAMLFAMVATSVNNFLVNGNTAGNAPIISANGADTNIDFRLSPKGTGVLDYTKAAVAATTPANFTATHMVDVKFNGVAYKIPARVAAW